MMQGIFIMEFDFGSKRDERQLPEMEDENNV